MKLVKDFMCDSCADLDAKRGMEFTGLGKYNKVQMCRACIIRGYEIIREDEKKEMVADMRMK